MTTSPAEGKPKATVNQEGVALHHTKGNHLALHRGAKISLHETKDFEASHPNAEVMKVRAAGNQGATSKGKSKAKPALMSEAGSAFAWPNSSVVLLGS